MIIVRICGGLGNQMFNYALYLYYQSKGYSTKLDISWYDRVHTHSGYELKDVFGIDAELATPMECQKYAFYKITLRNRILKRIIFRPNFYSQFINKESGFDERFTHITKGYIEGYFQSENYFSGIADQVREAFVFQTQNMSCLDLENQIKTTDSVSIHIRRGDYRVNMKTLLCDTLYYEKAIGYINKYVEKPVFYIFSNDIAWCRQKFSGDNFVFVDGNQGKKSCIDMYLMSICKNNIIADSTFSWWGAWLNSNENKIVIAPENWTYMKRKYTNILPDSWIAL